MVAVAGIVRVRFEFRCLILVYVLYRTIETSYLSFPNEIVFSCHLFLFVSFETFNDSSLRGISLLREHEQFQVYLDVSWKTN